MQTRYHSVQGTTRQASKSGAQRFLILLLAGLFAMCGTVLGSAPVAAIDAAGSVQVFLAPPQAVAAGAQWRLYGTDAWRASGDTMATVPAGTRYVVFRDTPGWQTPPAQSIQVVQGETTVTMGTYAPVPPPAFGSLQVTIAPAEAVAAGAKWWVDAYPGSMMPIVLHASGDTVNVPAGTHPVFFTEVAGWQQPEPLPVQIVSDQTTAITGTYLATQPPATGSVQVTLYPADAVTSGAQWSLFGMQMQPAANNPVLLWHNSGETVGNVPVGPYGVIFKEIAGWEQPRPVPVQVVANQTTVASGTYVPAQPPVFGSVQVTISPADAVTSGAQWRVDGLCPGPTTANPEPIWHNSGETVANVPVGLHGVIFKEIAGWQQPWPLPVHVVENQTTVTSGTYVHAQPPAFGSVMVTIYPADAVTSGAQWRLDGMWAEPMANPVLTWYSSGDTVANVPVGMHGVVFKPLPGWLAPMPVPVIVTQNQTAVTSGTYMVHTTERGSLQVTILPQAAADAGAQWRRSGSPAWHASSDTETGVQAGPCTVEFSPVAGWMRPGEQQVMVQPNQTAQCQGEYVQGTARIAPPIDVAASDGTYTDHVEVSWAAGTTVTTTFQVYRANSPFGARQAISGWQTDLLFEDSTATPDTTYFYWVKGATDAAGTAASDFSRPDAGWCGTTSGTLGNYQVSGTGCTITMPDSTHMTVQVTSGTVPCSVKIVRLRHLPMPGGGGGHGTMAPRASLTLPANAGLDQVQVNGNIVRFYTDAPVRELDVTGSLQMLSTCQADVANVSVGGSLGLVRMASQADGTSATTRIQSGAAGNSGLTILLNGIVLEALDTAQNVNVIGVNSKIFHGGPMMRALRRGRAALSGISTGGIGRVTLAAQADTIGEYKVHAASFGTIFVRGGSIVPDELLADSGTIQQISAMGAWPGASSIGGVIGNESDPAACRLLAPNFGNIFGGAGVHAVIVAGYDATQAPDFSGSVAVIGTRSGALSGEVDLSPDAAANLRLMPSAGSMVVVTAP